MPTRSSSQTRRGGFPAGAQLPVYLTTLIGRRRELDEVGRLLRAGRLVSLVGAGGSGKTRLAAAVASAVKGRFPGGIAWVDLAPLPDPEITSHYVATALGIREQAGRSPVDSLIERIGRNSVLLVLDNCEHLLGACATLVGTLLQGCAALRVLATSRQALGINGEKAWVVPPLPLPDPGAPAGDGDAVRLFAERAHDVFPDFELDEPNAEAVARICRRLDGLPLAIELAAARVRLLPPQQMARRLEGAFGLLSGNTRTAMPRHRTLRALFDWSYDLLSAEERLLLERLAVFAGGFTLDAAERIGSGGALPADQVLDALAGLVDKSLVSTREWRGEVRFTLLETVRQYAWERLQQRGEADDLRRRHAEYFLEFAESAEPHILGGARETEWMIRLEQEQDNLRAAMEWCREADQRAESALRLGSALLWFHFAHGRFHESRLAIEEALARVTELPLRARGRALNVLGYFALWSGDFAAAHAALATGVDLLRRVASPKDLAFALTGLGTVLGLAGERPVAFELFDEAEAALGDTDHYARGDFPGALLYAFANYWRGVVALSCGDVALARASFETAVAVGRTWHSHPTIGHPLAALARALILQGEFDAAEACLVESVTLHARHDDRWGLSQAFEACALLAEHRGHLEGTTRLVGAADRLRAQIGAARAPHESAERDHLLARAQEGLDAESHRAAYAAGEIASPHHLLAEITRRSATAARAEASSGLRSSPKMWRVRVGMEQPRAETGSDSQVDLRVRALGPLRILLGDRLLEGDAFGSSRPRELLLLLLCHPEGLTRDQVGLALWPDSSAAQVKNSFHVTLHRLRKALEHPDWIIAAGDRYRLDPALRIDFDAVRFSEAIDAALQQTDADGVSGAAVAEAIALYGGDFLEGEITGDWHLELRDRLRRRYHDGLLALGALAMDEERYADAADVYRTLLARDPLHEEASRRLMVCYMRAGERGQALRVYENLSTLLRAELNTTPDRSTTDLFHRLQAAGAS